MIGNREACPTDLMDFVELFRSQLLDQRDQLLAEYSADNSNCPPDEVAIPDRVAANIVYTVARWRTVECDERLLITQLNPPVPGSRVQTGLCIHHGKGFRCGCALPIDRRKIESFSARFHGCSTPLCFKNSRGTCSIGVLETLILHGEMGAVIRICRNAKDGIMTWRHLRQEGSTVHHAGWLRLMRLALRAYVVLNVLHTLSNSCGPAIEEEVLRSYRNMAWYQSLLLSSLETERGMFVPSLPHRDFLGLGIKTKKLPRENEDEDSERVLLSDAYLGKVTFQQFMSECEDIDAAHNMDCFMEVRMIMKAKGLPSEITNMIIELLHEVPWSTAGVDDPLARRNRAALRQYLRYCWTIVVRCFAVSSIMRTKLFAENELSRVLYELNRPHPSLGSNNDKYSRLVGVSRCVDCVEFTVLCR